ncbi:MAG: hypothetical protein ACXADC_06495 [Candidatus Thorarchaeota archaeon]|jgi:hypothetical protein
MSAGGIPEERGTREYLVGSTIDEITAGLNRKNGPAAIRDEG